MPDDAISWVIFDIDGTVADCRHRQSHVTKVVPDWESFFAASDIDGPLTEGVALAFEHAADGHLLWLTGRPERYRDVTVAWLQDQGLPTTHLHMRPDDDMRPEAVFKAERIQQLAADRDILLIVDDDDLVVAALRQAGWPVQHAQWMPA
jgi:hypothetical protein